MDTTTTGTVGLMNATHTIDDTGGWKIRARDVFHQTGYINLGITNQCQTGIDYFSQVMRRNVGRHAHGNTGRSVDQQVGDTRREHRGFVFGLVVVGNKIDGFLVKVGNQFMCDL